jgi:hypothetical protein
MLTHPLAQIMARTVKAHKDQPTAQRIVAAAALKALFWRPQTGDADLGTCSNQTRTKPNAHP